MHCDNLLSWIACNITPMPSSYTAPLQATLILYIVPTMTLLVILLFCMKHPDVHWNNLTCALPLLLSDLGLTSLPATESGRLVGAVCFVFWSVYCVTTVLLELSVSQLPLTIRCLAAPPWACILLLASSDSSSLFSSYHCPLYRCYTCTPPTPPHLGLLPRSSFPQHWMYVCIESWVMQYIQHCRNGGGSGYKITPAYIVWPVLLCPLKQGIVPMECWILTSKKIASSITIVYWIRCMM